MIVSLLQFFHNDIMLTAPPPHHCPVFADLHFHYFIILISLLVNRVISHHLAAAQDDAPRLQNLPVQSMHQRLSHETYLSHIVCHNKQLCLFHPLASPD